MMLLRNCNAAARLRFGLVLITLSIVTFCYYSFSKFVHGQHFRHEPNHDDHHHKENGGPFEGIYLKRDGLFLYGLALPLMLLGLVSSLWNPNSYHTASSTKRDCNNTSNTTRLESFYRRGGDVNAKKWSFLLFVMPLFVIMFLGSNQHFFRSRSQEEKQMHWSWWNSVLTSFMSPTGYAAVWALAAFLVPVTKHSPILDWLQVTPVQALAFHRLTGWTSLWCSIAHGILHLRHLLSVLRMHQEPRNTWLQELGVLLIPPSWDCIARQNPLAFMMGQQTEPEGDNEGGEADHERCWLALVNATGAISVLAFVILAITSLPWVRRSWYALFYVVHIPMAWIMLFMAIWHYPTCALVMIPNILYYLSFNIPVYVTQTMEYSRSKNQGKLLEANLIQGGVIELIFATFPKDERRHESRFVRLSHPKISAVMSHPFSAFSRQDLCCSSNEEQQHDTSPSTVSVLMRPTGPFTKSLSKILFPVTPAYHGEEESQQQQVLLTPLMSPQQEALQQQPQVQVDSFYAGSFGWLDHAVQDHDELLLVAGGVGIAPFLEFLPALHKQICCPENTNDHNTTDQGLPLQVMECSKRIHLHWYCREVGLVSYVWNTLGLGQHVQQVWEGQEISQGRLTIHVHLTSLQAEEETCIPDSSLVERHAYHDSLSSHRAVVKDAPTTQSWWYLPGSIMVAATAIHWWWYKKIIIKDEFRHDNLIMRGHSIIWTILFASIVSLVFFVLASGAGRNSIAAEESVVDRVPLASVVEDPLRAATRRMEHEEDPTTITSVLKVLTGRPPVELVTRSIENSHQPGVYMCGPQAMMESIEKAVTSQRMNSSCAACFYREDSEM